MSSKKSSVMNGCRFQLGSGGKKETLFAVALGVLVVGALAIVLTSVFKKPAPEGQFKFQCAACGHEFGITKADLPKLSEANGIQNATLDCPKCGAQKQSYMMQKCLSCGKHFLRSKTNDTCPYCGLSIKEALEKKIQE